MKKIILFIVSLSVSSFSLAALYARDLDGDMLNGHEGVYDDVLGVTWLANASAGGMMTWRDANQWAADFALNGFAEWRLPSLTPVNSASFQVDFSNGRVFDGSQDASYNVGQVGSASQGFTGSEFAYHYYINLGASAYVNPDGTGNYSAAGIANAVNTESINLFSNIQNGGYWLAPDYDGFAFETAWNFFTNDGFQDVTPSDGVMSAWLVHSGDIGTVVVPMPAAIWFFLSAIGGLTVYRRLEIKGQSPLESFM